MLTQQIMSGTIKQYSVTDELFIFVSIPNSLTGKTKAEWSRIGPALAYTIDCSNSILMTALSKDTSLTNTYDSNTYNFA